MCFMTTPFNILAPCPVLAVPSGIAPSNGVPTGIQIVARTYDDVTAFRIGAASGAGSAVDRPGALRRMSDEERFQPLVDADLAAWPEMPGRLLHVLAPGLGVDLEVAAGVEELGRDRPLQPGSRFRIASVTKPFVAAAALRLVEQGRVSLDDTVARLLEGEYEELLRRGGYETDAITLRHLLTHTSGIYDFAADAYGDELTDGFTAQVAKDPGHRWTRLEQITWAVDYGKPYGPPGTVFALLRHRRLPRRRGARADHRRDDGRGDPRRSSTTSGSA